MKDRVKSSNKTKWNYVSKRVTIISRRGKVWSKDQDEGVRSFNIF